MQLNHFSFLIGAVYLPPKMEYETCIKYRSSIVEVCEVNPNHKLIHFGDLNLPDTLSVNEDNSVPRYQCRSYCRKLNQIYQSTLKYLRSIYQWYLFTK